MKVICINNDGCKDYLTIGKVYNIISEVMVSNKKMYNMKDDCDYMVGIYGKYFSHRFIVLKELRKQKLQKIMSI